LKQKFFNNIPLVISLLLTMAIATTEVPLWTSIFSLSMVLWKFLHEYRGFPKLSPKLTPILGLAVFIVVYIQHRTIFGQEESTTILLALTGISILNFETERDLLFLVLLGFLMLVLKSVFSLDFYWALPAMVSFFGLWLTLISNPHVNRSRYLFKTTLRSVPLLFLLFVLFPRLVIFQTKKLMNPVAQSGFSEELNPGRFTSLALSDQTVFRVEFLNTDTVESQDLYWRGAVLYNSNNFVWRKGVAERQDAAPGRFVPRTLVQYRVVLEPLNRKNIFVLDSPVRVHSSSEPLMEWKQGVYTMVESQQKLVQFSGESTYDGIDLRGDTIDKPRYLKISELPPKTKEWVEKTRELHLTPEARIQALNAFFQKPGFVYTLSPDQYRNDLDEFLFVKKRGFCEHYAAAYGTMARALGVPSRVVIGYQGGTYNSVGNFWKISQKDSHAWVEVGLNGHWQRVDPTGFVTPLRISLGADEYFSLSEFERLYFSKDKNLQRTVSFRSLVNKAVSLFENLNYNWTLFLLNYDLETQLQILKSVRSGWLYLLFGLIVLIIAGNMLLKKFRFQRNKRHALFELLRSVEAWASGSGVDIPASLPPLMALEKIAQKYPAARGFVDEFGREYELLIYSNKVRTGPVKVARLKKSWREFQKNIKKAA
jgi:transglutaminase-like putative cysteine protease